MKTTKNQAIKFYNIANHINPFESCSYDKKEEIENLLQNTFEQNLEYLNGYILEYYDTLADFISDYELIRQYNNILKDIRK